MPGRSPASASRRSPPPAPDSPGRSAGPTITSRSMRHWLTCRPSSKRSSVPVNADFEGGFATEPEDVGANVAAAARTGIAGLSIEDSTGDASNPLFDFALAVERIRAARQAIDDSGTGVLLTGRSEGFIVGRPDLPETIRRLTAYAEAGADCLYAPGIRTKAEIAAVVGAVAPKPVNVLVGSDFTTVAELAEAGVRRISVGGALARAAVDRVPRGGERRSPGRGPSAAWPGRFLSPR